MNAADMPHDATAKPPRPRINLGVWLLLAVAVIALLAGLLTLARQQVERQAQADIRNLNLTLEARLNASLQGVHTGLQGIALRISDGFFQTLGHTEASDRQIRALAKRFPDIAEFQVLGLDGQVLFAPAMGGQASFDQLRFWATLKQRPADASNVSTLLLDHDKGRDVLHLAVPVFDDQQHQVGWIAASQPLKAMLDLLRQVDVGVHGVITVRRTDQPEIILRTPKPANAYRQYLPDDIDRMIVQGEQQGSLVMGSRVDGVKRLYGFKRIGAYDLAIVTGLATQDYLAGWRYTVVATSLVCGGLFLLIIGLNLRLQKINIRRQQVVEELRNNAYHDALTGLPNRRFLRERVNHCVAACANAEQRLALLYFDVDHFKTINDSLGHISGDGVLQVLAQRLLALQPQVDTVARLGGDEFLVLVSDDDRERLSELLDNILRTVREPFELQGYRLSITASVGVALYPEHGQDFGSLLKAADTALYQAKADGRNTWAFYETAMGERGLWLLQIQSQLRNAHEQGELSIHYQPQINLLTGKVTGAEALMRWTHPERGAIAPSEFIPVAESSGLILPMSRWLLHEVCKQAIAWQVAGFGELTVAMNCSAVQFRQGDLVEDVRQALLETGLKPHLLELELTESILIENSERVMQMIGNLKALGVKLSIDDFGTGYSSMAYLKRFEVDKLKIDQSFVRGMLEDPKDAAIVRAVIGLGHSLDMTVIAEGIEHLAIVDALIAGGCDEAQGYHYARPLTTGDFHAFMHGHLQVMTRQYA
jgi:diguanylate cyclase (GGDEF)-like protein